MKDFLKEIVDYKRKEVEEKKARFNLPVIFEEARGMSVRFNFKDAFRPGRVNIIAEVKKASPSKGVIRRDFDPVKIAEKYYEGGAAAISVLTDEKFFMGSPYYLRQIAEVVSLPLLRKDFIVDEFQIYSSKVLRASSFLLITSILSDNELSGFISLGRDLGMEPLVEVHNAEEVDRAIRCGAFIIGVNNRNLRNFSVDLGVTLKLLPVIKDAGKLCISESGIGSRETIHMLFERGVDGFLIGEALMRSNNSVKVLKEWVSLS